VRFGPLESDWVEKNWPADFLAMSKAGTYSRVDILTNQTKDLRDLLSQNAGSTEAFGFASYLCRPGADCDARAIQDQLARTPDNRDALTGSVKFYAKRGNFARAIVLQRHKIALGSDEATDQLELGRLLLLTRDFDGARRVLATAKEQSDTASAIKVLAVRAYFLEGDYAGTVQAAKSLEASGKLVSADPIILSYFALHRLGRVEEAESYLQQHAATLVGPAEEHLLLLEVSGRVTDSWASKDWTRSTYYYALNALKNKNLNEGREHLRDLARMRPKDDLIGLAAQVELERLPSPASK
jgi:Flp pilus assembly protein TadD